MIRRIIPTMAFLPSLSLSAKEVKSVSLPSADVTDAPHAWTVPPLWSELQGGYRGCREKLIFLWSVKVGLFDPLAPVRQCSCRAYYQKSPINLLTYRTLRRERDSNPRYLAVRRFSRPVHSTTLPSLHANYGRLFLFASAKIHNVWQYAKYLLYFFRRLLTVASWCANVQTYRCKELTS